MIRHRRRIDWRTCPRDWQRPETRTSHEYPTVPFHISLHLVSHGALHWITTRITLPSPVSASNLRTVPRGISGQVARRLADQAIHETLQDCTHDLVPSIVTVDWTRNRRSVVLLLPATFIQWRWQLWKRHSVTGDVLERFPVTCGAQFR